jgi:nucleotide-binding universal stress UspA family protein
MRPLDHVLLATDLNGSSLPAWLHALRLAVASHARLDVVHVQLPGREAPWSVLPGPRDLLVRWGVLGPDDDVHAFERLGVHVGAHALASLEFEAPIALFLHQHPPDLMVVGTRARKGFGRLQVPSLAEELARTAQVSTLFVPVDARPFVDERTGAVTLRHVLVPAGTQEDLDVALPAALRLVDAYGAVHVTIHVVHVGDRATAPRLPDLDDPRIELALDVRHGPLDREIVDAILGTDADLCVMATRGHDSLADVLRGSHTEIVVRHAACPVLAVPIAFDPPSVP